MSTGGQGVALIARRLPVTQGSGRRGFLALGLLGPSAVLLGVLFFYPLLGIVLRSLNPVGDLSFSHPTFDFANYVHLYSNAGFRAIFVTTFKIAAITTGVCLVIGYPVAYILSGLPRGVANALLLVIMVPFWTSILVRLYAWTVILGPRGMVNSALQGAGVTDQPASLLFNTTSVIIGMVHYLLPYMVLILYSTMIRIDRSLIQAAYSMGARPTYMFRRVFLPLSLPGVYAGALLVFIIALGYFVTPAVLGGGSSITLPMYIQREAEQLSWGVASAMGVVLLCAAVIFFIIFDRVFGMERLVQGGDR